METLGARIKQLRKQLTQEELAVILQVDRSTLASWEVNRREPDIATLCRLANFFQVSVDWLVGHKPVNLPPAGQAREQVNDYRTESEEAWQPVIAIARHYHLSPDILCQIIELNVKIAASLKADGPVDE